MGMCRHSKEEIDGYWDADTLKKATIPLYGVTNLVGVMDKFDLVTKAYLQQNTAKLIQQISNAMPLWEGYKWDGSEYYAYGKLFETKK